MTGYCDYCGDPLPNCDCHPDHSRHAFDTRRIGDEPIEVYLPVLTPLVWDKWTRSYDAA